MVADILTNFLIRRSREYSHVLRCLVVSSILCLCSDVATARQGWREILLPVSHPQISSISFADSMHGCLWGSDLVFLYTSDGGATWRTDTITGSPVGSVGLCTLASDSILWAWVYRSMEERQSTILRSADAGRSWEIRNPPDSLQIIGAILPSAGKAWVVTPDRVWVTTSAGISWESRGSPPLPGSMANWFLIMSRSRTTHSDTSKEAEESWRRTSHLL